MEIDHGIFIAPPGTRIRLDDFDTAYTGDFNSPKKAKERLAEDIRKTSKLQNRLFAVSRHSVLVIFQAMDAAGKDGTIKHVMSGVNPQGCQVHTFRTPSQEELDHDFLWRTTRRMPRRGKIGIFNRSYYEEVLITRVHPEYILKQNIPGITAPGDISDGFWENRYTHINNFEKQQADSGTIILKFFLHLSKDEQKARFLARINKAKKNWKFTLSDIKERQMWDVYQQAYEEAINKTSTKWAPWYIIPADNKWYMRMVVCDILATALEKLDLKYPKVDDRQKHMLLEAKEMLLNEEKPVTRAGS
jgi:PPK2 family polyphosphate:nucleotide phosphotransferase